MEVLTAGVPQPKLSLAQKLAKVFNAFKMIFLPKKDDNISRYMMLVNRYNLTGDDYVVAQKAAELCDTGAKIAESRLNYTLRQSDITNEIRDLTNISQFSDDELKEIKELLRRLENIAQEKSFVQNQVADTDQALYYLERVESQVPDAIIEIEEAEGKQRLMQRDMNYISDEREELVQEKANLEEGLVFIYKLTIVSICVFAILAFSLAVLNIFFATNVFIYSAGLMVVAIFFGTIVLISRRKMKHELQKNTRLQMRAIELLNGKKLQYVHYTTFLNYEYKKFRVESAEQLKKYWAEYALYKQASSRYKHVKNAMYEVEDDIRDFLNKRGIRDTKTTVDCINKINKMDTNRKSIDSLSNELKRVQGDLTSLEKAQEELWSQISVLRSCDDTDEKIIVRMTDLYLNDIEKMYASVV